MLLIQRNRLARRRRWTRTAAMGLTLALLSGAFMVFQGRIFLWMRLVEAARLTTERISWLRNGIGLAIDQQYGLLSYSPVWLAAVAGSLVRGKNSRRIRIYSLLSLPYIAGLCLVDFWTGGWSPATRFLTVVIPFWIPALARGIDVLLRQNCRWTVVTLSVLSALATSMVLIAPSWAIAPTDPPSTSNRWMAAIGATASMPLTCMLPSAWRMNGIFWSALPVLVIAAVVHRRLLRNSMKFSPSCWGTCLIGCLLLVLAYLPSRATSVEWTLSDLNTINGLESCLSPRGTLVGSHCRIDVPGMASSTTSTYRIAVGRANCCPLESIQQTLEFRTGPNREARNYSIWSDEMTYWQIHTHEGESNDVLSCTASGAAAGVEIRSIEMFQHRPHLSQLHQFMAQKLRCVLPEWEYLALLRRAACYDPGNRTAKHLALNHILSEKKYLKAVRTFPELISSPPEATPEIARARLALLAVLLAPQSEQDSSCPQLHDLAMAGWHEKALACLRAGDANAAAQLRRETTGDSVLDAAIALLSGDSQQAEVILNHRWNEGSITAWELQLFSELLRGSGRSAHVNAMLNRRLPAITTDYYGVSDFFHEGGLSEGSAWKLTTFGGIYRLVALADGPQIITLRARGEPARHEWPVVIILIDGQAVSRITLDNDDFFNTYLKLDLAPGIHLLEIQYVNDYSYAKDQQDRNAVIERIVIDHPVLRALALQ